MMVYGVPRLVAAAADKGKTDRIERQVVELEFLQTCYGHACAWDIPKRGGLGANDTICPRIDVETWNRIVRIRCWPSSQTARNASQDDRRETRDG